MNLVVSEQKRQKDRRSPKASPVRMQERAEEDYESRRSNHHKVKRRLGKIGH
jgi:hypothetical protein